MDANLDEKISIELSKGEWLVIFEFLARSYEACCETGNKDENTFVLSTPVTAERVVTLCCREVACYVSTLRLTLLQKSA